MGEIAGISVDAPATISVVASTGTGNARSGLMIVIPKSHLKRTTMPTTYVLSFTNRVNKMHIFTIP